MKRLILSLGIIFFLAGQARSETYQYSLSPGADTFTDSYYNNGAMGDPAGTHWDRLWAGPVINDQAACGFPAIDGTVFAHTYLRFNLGSVSQINDATLYLYRVNDTWGNPHNPIPGHPGEYYPYNDPDVGNLTVYYETDNVWNEETMTWDLEPGMTNFTDNTAGETVFIGPPGGWNYPNNGGWVSWNVTSFAQQAKASGQLTLVLANDDNVTPFEPFHIFYSSESTEYPALRPYLGVNVVPEPVSMLLFGLGGVALTLARRRKQN
jgi:hypothetical protein